MATSCGCSCGKRSHKQPTVSQDRCKAQQSAQQQHKRQQPPAPPTQLGRKFVPLDDLPPAASPTPVVEGTVPDGASILIIQQPWIGLILDGRKTNEIRGRICKKRPGERVYLALSGGGGIILGSAEFTGCTGPLTEQDYAARANAHCVAGAALPYGGSTYAWGVRAPERFAQPVRYRHKPGVVVWAKMEAAQADERGK